MIRELWKLLNHRRAARMFDWLPDPKWLSWSILIAICFGLAALEVYVFNCSLFGFGGSCY